MKTIANKPKSSQETSPGRVPALARASAVWDHEDFVLKLEKAKAADPTELSATDLLDFCRGASRHFRKHYWVDARPFFVELWDRIERKKIPEVPTKTAACKEIGCTLRWAEAIVAGTAKDSNAPKANGERSACEVTSHDRSKWSNRDYFNHITSHAISMLDTFTADDPGKRSLVCLDLERLFAEAAAVRHASDLVVGPDDATLVIDK